MAIPYFRHEIITLFSQQISPYLLGVTAALILPLWWIYKMTKIHRLNPLRMIGLTFVIIIGAFWGGRVFHYFGPWGAGWFQYQGIFDLSQGGHVFYGGLIGATIAGYVYLKLQNENAGTIADLVAPAIPLGQFLSRLVSCFFMGDDFGTPSNLPWAIQFLGPGYQYLIGTTIHPVQIYLSLGNLLVFTILLELRNYKQWEGQIFASYILLHGMMRFFLEFFRDTTESTATLIFGFTLTYSQLISLILVLVSLLFILKKTQKEKKTVFLASKL
ncbi:MAG: prolipoprotein diacylglyceryl transferase [Nanoarchaeota archaeon]|nr:prolipoprotein diacylglyceryl transferase [Nanoarchaeota archaeon]